MKVFSLSKVILMIFLLSGTTIFASEQKQPPTSSSAEGEIKLKVPLFSSLFSGFPVAVVNDEQITIEDLNTALSSFHEGIVEDKKQVAKIDYQKVLRRLINTRLIIQEARNIGLNEMQEIKDMVDVYSRVTLKELLIEELGENIKVDENEVEKIYKESVKEWKIRSVIFEKEADAKRMGEEIKAGKSFEEMVGKLVADKTAKGGEEGDYIKPKDLLPQIAEVVSNMGVGTISPIIKVGSGEKLGYVILKLEEVRFAENLEARERARQAVLSAKKVEATKDYKRSLYKKYVKLNKKLIDSLDYESKKPGFQKLLKDNRVVAEIKGEKPIRVKELTEILEEKFYHGVEGAIEGKRINKRKMETLEEIIDKRLFIREALEKGIGKTEKYKNMVKEFENSIIFEAFIQKVVVPDVKVNEEELRTYYNEHIGEFSYPETMKINSIIFSNEKDAEVAIDKLTSGADFKWIKDNAEGQVDKGTKGLLPFEGNVLSTKDLPEGSRKAVSGANPGDFRLYASPAGYFYVLFIQDVIPSEQISFDKVKEIISKKVFNNRLDKTVEDWFDRLREVSDIKIYISEPDN